MYVLAVSALAPVHLPPLNPPMPRSHQSNIRTRTIRFVLVADGRNGRLALI